MSHGQAEKEYPTSFLKKLELAQDRQAGITQCNSCTSLSFCVSLLAVIRTEPFINN